MPDLPDGGPPGWLLDLVPLLEGVPVAARLPLLVFLGSLAGWGLANLVVSVATRPRSVRPGPATQDLGGDEPPAVVTVLGSGWSVTEDAAEATLIDLAARGHLEFRQPDADPLHTTVQVSADDAGPLTGYEQQVLDHVRQVAAGVWRR